ncbi:TorF family putative porin [Sphingobium phenoxybenzoativorans]|uniref:TorF family putative porin n=1 Tax=Sphingobium phenoxybenzoativorans TaxID=1592790 RepID=A0A975K825_9SPHN|nr:TorF family putative porin [Sphingobium phenoxybenzoativorans]QUT06526.1 TorF family putative porin [Sphingobium phenoxybenzoativorans]
MRKSVLGLSAVLLSTLAAAPAFAQDEPTPAVTVTANAAVVSDYRFRGISQTDKRFALQGGITVSHESGFYVSAWGSSIDDYVAAGGDQELDLIAGFSKTVGAATFDVGVLYYYYPGSGGANTDFIEPYASIKGTFGPATAKLTANYAPKSSALSVGNGKEDNLYIAGDLSATLPDTPIGFTAHLGHSFGPSYLTIGKEYTDWNVGASYTWDHLTFGVGYFDTNKNAYSPTGRNISKAGVVASITAAF